MSTDARYTKSSSQIKDSNYVNKRTIPMNNNLQNANSGKLVLLNPNLLANCNSVIDLISKCAGPKVSVYASQKEGLVEPPFDKGIDFGESNCELNNRSFLSTNTDRSNGYEATNIINKMTDEDSEQRNQADKRVLEFIERMEYPKIYIGRITPKQMTKVDWRIERKGKMNPEEKELFDYVNRILQHPSCISKCEQIKSTSRDKYSYAISRYLVFMAKRKIGIEQFTIDGVLLMESMREYVEEKTNEGKSGDFWKTIDGAQHALAFVNHCIALYKCRNVQDRIIADERVKKLRVVPNMRCLTEFASERRKRHNEIARENFHDKHRKEYTNETYTIDNLKAMMVNMYNMTGEGGKKNIYHGINTVLEILLGHHLLYRGDNKRRAELSDITFTKYYSARGIVPILGFTTDRGKTLSTSEKPHSMGACRNKYVEICLVTAISMSIWYRFDFEGDYAPLTGDNRPDFLDKSSWGPVKVLFADSAKSRKNDPISYKYEASLVNLCLESIGVSLTKSTHLGRQGGARKADANQVEMSQIKTAGGWKQSILDGSYLESYPLEFIFSSGGFALDEPYDCLRDIEPPKSLQSKIFPWLESVIEAVDARHNECELKRDTDKDTTTDEFLQMLKTFRKIILQDLTNLTDRAPNSIFARHPIAKEPEFVRFKERVRRVQEELGLSESMQDKRAMANIVTPLFVQKVDGSLQSALNRVHLSMMKQFEEYKEHQDLKLLLNSKDRDQVLKEDVKGLVKGIWREMNNTRFSKKDTKENSNVPQNQKSVEEMYGNEQLIDKLTTIQTELTEKVSKMSEKLNQSNDQLSLMLKVVSDRVAGPNIKSMDPLISNNAVDVDASVPEVIHSAAAIVLEPNVGIDEQEDVHSRERATGCLKSSGAIDLSQVVPSLRMRADSNTVMKLLEEWYVSKPGIPSVQKKNQIYGSRWRGTSSIYKRRKAIINFIETHLGLGDVFPNITKKELGQLIDDYRVRNRLKMNGLSARFQNAHSKEVITKELQEIWGQRNQNESGVAAGR